MSYIDVTEFSTNDFLEFVANAYGFENSNISLTDKFLNKHTYKSNVLGVYKKIFKDFKSTTRIVSLHPIHCTLIIIMALEQYNVVNFTESEDAAFKKIVECFNYLSKYSPGYKIASNPLYDKSNELYFENIVDFYTYVNCLMMNDLVGKFILHAKN